MDADNAGIEAQVGGGRRASGLYLAHLVDCALHGAAPEVLPEGASWEEVHALAARNGMEGASWRAAALAGDVPSELRRRWAAEADMTLLRLLRFDAEREQVLSAMAARGLSYLPLKGVLIAGYYPAPEMRSMADNDILYGFVEPDEGGGFRISGADEAERGRATALAVREAAALMAERGYEAVSLGKGNHESFHKKPSFNFELHRRLVASSSPHAAYSANPWKRALRDGTDSHLLRFSDEDEYLYFLVHAHKHFDSAGCGIRFVADLRVLLDAKGARMDWGYVRSELKALGLADFEACSRSLADAAFGGACSMAGPDGGPLLNGVQESLLIHLLGCGTYGTMEERIRRQLGKIVAENEGDLARAKRRYLLERTFIPEDAIKDAFPAFHRHKALRPLLPAYRACRGLARHPKRIWRELKMLFEAR